MRIEKLSSWSSSKHSFFSLACSSLMFITFNASFCFAIHSPYLHYYECIGSANMLFHKKTELCSNKTTLFCKPVTFALILFLTNRGKGKRNLRFVRIFSEKSFLMATQAPSPDDCHFFHQLFNYSHEFWSPKIRTFPCCLMTFESKPQLCTQV